MCVYLFAYLILFIWRDIDNIVPANDISIDGAVSVLDQRPVATGRCLEYVSCCCPTSIPMAQGARTLGNRIDPLVNVYSLRTGKSPSGRSKPTVNEPFSIANC